MNTGPLKYLLLSLALLVGCNKEAFIEDTERLKVSANDIIVPDTGGTMQVNLNKEDWIIELVSLTDEIGKHYTGNVMEGGQLRESCRMEMKGFGEIWMEYLLGGFKVTRNDNQSLTVCLEANHTYQERTLSVILKCGIETLELRFIQKPSEGFVIDRVEWDNPESTSSSTRKITSQLQREIFIKEAMSIRNKLTFRHYVLKILNVQSITLTIPDSVPTDGKLTFSGDSIELDDRSSYKLDVDGRGNLSGTHVKYLSYNTTFRLYLKHIKDESITLCVTGTFFSTSPDFS